MGYSKNIKGELVHDLIPLSRFQIFRGLADIYRQNGKKSLISCYTSVDLITAIDKNVDKIVVKSSTSFKVHRACFEINQNGY